ncbi:MAG: CBS domain-containing protein [Acidobacteria bacterium]|nr:MAG: CBS domain-containing protein [Acidobacteriota bacterium]REK02972.1 MAG: CBS domain-containing protein [Acidobacteriota bacterium]REK13224.1 MAG: CBS domain-containing protein [Acidobacteriota bacterium]REK41218.1 MAG: CBS domain-containing protein [Acidobacteriota bacterium]
MNEIGTTARKRLKCRRIMAENVSTATRSSTVQAAAEILRDEDIGILPIIDEDGGLVGVLTDRDIVIRAVAGGMDITDTKVGDIMTEELFTARPDDFVFEVLRTMGEKQVRRIPIVDEEGILKGIISMADIALEMEDEREVAETLEEISSGAAFWNKN